MPSDDRVDIVRFSGGEHHGLVVEAPPSVAANLHAMKFEVLASGRLYDLTHQRRIPGARVLTTAIEHQNNTAPAGPETAVVPPAQPALQPWPEPLPPKRPAPEMPRFQAPRTP